MTGIPIANLKVNNTYRPDIDRLRALAIILVVLFHAFPSIFGGGFIGVDNFCVMSGYLIYKIFFLSFHKNKLI